MREVITVTLLIAFLPLVTLAPSAGVGGPMTIPTSTYELITPDGVTFNLTQAGLSVRQRIGDGMGLPPVEHKTFEMYGQPGAVLDTINIKPRLVTITANAYEDPIDAGTMNRIRAALFGALRWNRVAGSPPPPSTLRYTFDGKSADLKVYYLSDVEAVEADYVQKIGIRLIAYEPMFYSPTQTTTDVAAASTPNVSYILGLIAGIWSAMGNNGTGTVYSIVVSPDGDSVYVGGRFNGWGGLPNGKSIVKYTISTGVWSALGTGITGSGQYVFAIALDAVGDVYVGGDFTHAGGVAAANIAKFDTSAGTWSALGAGTNDWVRAIVIDADTGDLYVGGQFTVPFNYIARWDVSGAAWADLGADNLNGFVYALKFNIGGYPLYAGGSFTTADGVTVNNVAMYNPGFDAWYAMGSGTNGLVDAVAVAASGNVYVGGTFTTAGGLAASKIAMWNGSWWSALGSGVNAQVYSLAFDDQDLLYVGGVFTSAGGLALADSIANWNGTVWSHIDADLPGVATVTAIATSGANHFYGFDTTGAARCLGAVTTVTNDGDADAYPQITVLGPGLLQYIENTVTHKRMLFNMTINAGETVTIDLSPGVKTITSDWRGNMLPYATLLPQSDFGTFCLVPDPIAGAGQNGIRVMMDDTTGATHIHFLHYDAYLSVDEAVQ